jgi:hypothetical protein
MASSKIDEIVEYVGGTVLDQYMKDQYIDGDRIDEAIYTLIADLHHCADYWGCEWAKIERMARACYRDDVAEAGVK